MRRGDAYVAPTTVLHCTIHRWKPVGVRHAVPLRRQRQSTSESPGAHPITLLQKNYIRTMHIIEQDSVRDSRYSCSSYIPSVFAGLGEEASTLTRPRWRRGAALPVVSRCWVVGLACATPLGDATAGRGCARSRGDARADDAPYGSRFDMSRRKFTNLFARHIQQKYV